jgi:hypothetical protein
VTFDLKIPFDASIYERGMLVHHNDRVFEAGVTQHNRVLLSRIMGGTMASATWAPFDEVEIDLANAASREHVAGIIWSRRMMMRRRPVKIRVSGDRQIEIVTVDGGPVVRIGASVKKPERGTVVRVPDETHEQDNLALDNGLPYWAAAMLGRAALA